MSDIYNIYELNFKTLCKNINLILNREEFNTKTITQLRNDIKEINRILKQMNLEINNLKLSNKIIPKEIEENLSKYKHIVDEYNNNLVLIQNNYCFNYENNKKNILIDDDENNKEMKFIEEDFNTQQKINNIRRDVTDIEKMGYNIENNLENQNEQIKYMNNNVKMMNYDADLTNDLVNQIINRAKRNKIIFYSLLIILVIIFIISMIIKKNKD